MEQEGQFQAASQVFLTRLSGWEGPKAILSNRKGYELVLFPGWNRGINSKPSKALVCGLESSQPTPQVPWQMALLCGQSALPALLSTLALLGYTLSRCSGQPFWSGVVKTYTQQYVRLWLSSPTRAGAEQCPGLAWLFIKNSNQAFPHPTTFPDQTAPLTWFCRWAELLIGITAWALQVGTWSAKIQVPVVASPYTLLIHKQNPSGQVHKQTSLQFMWGETRAKISKKWPTVLVKLNVHSGLSFPIGGSGGSARPFKCCAMLAYGRAM